MMTARCSGMGIPRRMLWGCCGNVPHGTYTGEMLTSSIVNMPALLYLSLSLSNTASQVYPQGDISTTFPQYPANSLTTLFQPLPNVTFSNVSPDNAPHDKVTFPKDTAPNVTLNTGKNTSNSLACVLHTSPPAYPQIVTNYYTSKLYAIIQLSFNATCLFSTLAQKDNAIKTA